MSKQQLCKREMLSLRDLNLLVHTKWLLCEQEMIILSLLLIVLGVLVTLLLLEVIVWPVV